jgi:anti-sigma-K factor RskA
MNNDHDRYAEWAAAYTLGALDAEDRRAFETHLAACSVCAAELAALAPVPALIAKIDPGDVERQPDPAHAASIAAAAKREIRAIRRRSRRWQLTAAGFAAAALILVAVLLVTPRHGDNPPAQTASVLSSAASTTDVTVSPRAWGTEITLHITGLPARDSYQLWTVDINGTWTTAATWSPTPAGVVRLTGASRTPTDQIERVLITSQDPDDLLVAASV